jgi:hypothetical protein
MVLAAGIGGMGQGAIVIRDQAPVFENVETAKSFLELNRGTSVVGSFKIGRGMFYFHVWELKEQNGRVHVSFFALGGKHPT